MPIWSLLFIASAAVAGRSLADSPANYIYSGSDWGSYCAGGSRQSPIDFADPAVFFLDDGLFSEVYTEYKPFAPTYGFTAVDYRVEGGFGAIQLSSGDGSTIDRYEGESVVFHAPSEHTINGQHFDLEMQLRHRFVSLDGGSAPSNSSTAVLSILFELGDESDLLTAVVTNAERLDFSALMKDGSHISDFYVYEGSETTFPCEETVRWAVAASPMQASADQVTFFFSKWADNAAFARGNGNNRATVSKGEGRQVSRVLW